MKNAQLKKLEEKLSGVVKDNERSYEEKKAASQAIGYLEQAEGILGRLFPVAKPAKASKAPKEEEKQEKE